MRVYKLKAFARFQRREGIADAGLVKAVRSAEESKRIEAAIAAGELMEVRYDEKE